MKLIGGNISDTPIKDVSDGSAFSAGGGGATPKTISVAATATSISGWDKPWTGMFTYKNTGGTHYKKLDDSNWIFVWRSITDNKVKAAIITFDSSNNPTFGSQTSLTAFTDSVKAPVWVEKVSSTRVLIMSVVEISTFLNYQIQVYDISGTTITAAAGLSLQTVAMLGVSNDFSAGSASLHVVDANRAVLSSQDYYRNTDSRRYHYGIRFTATQNVGSSVDFGASQGAPPNYEGGGNKMTFPISSTQMMQADSYSMSTLDISADSTPVISNLVIVSSTIGDGDGIQRPGGTYQYNDVRKLQIRPDNPSETTEFLQTNWWVLGHYSGASSNTLTYFNPNQPNTQADSGSLWGTDVSFILLSQSGTTFHVLYSFIGGASGLNTRRYQTGVIDVSNKAETWGELIYPATGINSSSQGLLGGIIRPNSNATRLTIFEYQEAATAGWYYATIDVA